MANGEIKFFDLSVDIILVHSDEKLGGGGGIESIISFRSNFDQVRSRCIQLYFRPSSKSTTRKTRRSVYVLSVFSVVFCKDERRTV